MTPVLAQGLRADRSFERIYRRHVGDVYRYALAVLRNPADAEDVTQTTFMNAYRAYAGGERPRQPQNWLIAIAHNVCRQRFRQSQRRPQEVAYDDNVGEWLEEDDRGPTADDLRRALSHLAFNQRAALVMRELEGRSYAEIGEILGLTVAAVETLIFRARRALREQLEGTLTCAEAERALSLEADGCLPRNEKGPLRAHLRECKDCAAAARRQRAQRSAWKALGALPVPASLSSLFGGGGAALGVKAAAVAASAIVAGGIGLAGERHFTSHPPKAKRPTVARPAQARLTPAVAAIELEPAPAAAAVTHRKRAVVAHKNSSRGHRGAIKPHTPVSQGQHRGNSNEAPANRVHPAQSRPVTPQQHKGKAVGHERQKTPVSRGKARGHDKVGAVVEAPGPDKHPTKQHHGAKDPGGSGQSSGNERGSRGQGASRSAIDVPALPLADVPEPAPGTRQGKPQVSP